jgi:hypothetical protein
MSVSTMSNLMVMYSSKNRTMPEAATHAVSGLDNAMICLWLGQRDDHVHQNLHLYIEGSVSPPEEYPSVTPWPTPSLLHPTCNNFG